MPYCKVVGCKTRPGKGCTTTWHHLPRDENLRRQWIKRINRVGYTEKDWMPIHCVCGLHFIDPDDYVYPSPSQAVSLGFDKKRFILKENAVPSLSLGKPAAACEKPRRKSLAIQKRQNIEVRNDYLILVKMWYNLLHS